MWDAFGNPDKPANEMPGGTYNSAGGKPREVTWKDAFSFTARDLHTFYKTPCARDSLLVGGVGGVAVGGVTTVVKGENMVLLKQKVEGGKMMIFLSEVYWKDWRRRRCMEDENRWMDGWMNG